MQRKGNLTNLWTYIMILVIFALFVFMIKGMGSELVANQNNNLDADSLTYINDELKAGIADVDIGKTKSEINETIQDSGADTGTNLEFDFGFLATRAKAKEILQALGGIYNIPTTILKIFRFPLGEFTIISNIINLMIWSGLIFGIIYLWKGAK